MWYIEHSALGTTWNKAVKYIAKIGDRYIYPAGMYVYNTGKNIYKGARRIVRRPIVKYNAKHGKYRKNLENDPNYKYYQDENYYTNISKNRKKFLDKYNNMKNRPDIVMENQREAAYTNANKRRRLYNYGKPERVRENEIEANITNRNRRRKQRQEDFKKFVNDAINTSSRIVNRPINKVIARTGYHKLDPLRRDKDEETKYTNANLERIRRGKHPDIVRENDEERLYTNESFKNKPFLNYKESRRYKRINNDLNSIDKIINRAGKRIERRKKLRDTGLKLIEEAFYTNKNRHNKRR